MANLHGYGTTEAMPMVANCKIHYDDADDTWVLVGKCEGASVFFTAKTKEDVIYKWREYNMINRSYDYDPE
jgi:hypothetical protein